MNQYEYEDAKVDCLNAAASCLRALYHTLPYILIIVALGSLMQTALSTPYTLTCKTIPAEKPVRQQRYRAPLMTPATEELNPVETASPVIKANPVRED
jgi:hypothetical protein